MPWINTIYMALLTWAIYSILNSSINIYAQNLDNGKVTVSVTEIDGSFNFQLVEGKYKFYTEVFGKVGIPGITKIQYSND